MVFNTVSGQLLKRLQAAFQAISKIAVTADERYLLLASDDKKVHVWDLRQLTRQASEIFVLNSKPGRQLFGEDDPKERRNCKGPSAC